MIEYRISKSSNENDTYPYDEDIPEYCNTIKVHRVSDEAGDEYFEVVFHGARGFLCSLDIFEHIVSKMCECRESWDACEDGDISISIHCCEYMQYITIVDADRIVPIVRTEGILDIDDIGISREIIVDNSPSSIDNWVFAIGNIDPCLSPPDIRHITRDEEDIITVSIVFSIGHHRIVIGEDHHGWSALSICLYECWSDDIVLDDMDLPESFFLCHFFFLFDLLIVLPLQS